MSEPSPGTETYWEELDDVQEDDEDDELESTVVGMWMEDSCDVYIGRGDSGDAHIHNTEIGSRGWLGNPYTLEEYDREESIAKFCTDLLDRVDEDPEFARSLVDRVAGQRLGCWCRCRDEDAPVCHGDVIADVADRLAEKSQRRRDL